MLQSQGIGGKGSPDGISAGSRKGSGESFLCRGLTALADFSNSAAGRMDTLAVLKASSVPAGRGTEVPASSPIIANWPFLKRKDKPRLVLTLQSCPFPCPADKSASFLYALIRDRSSTKTACAEPGLVAAAGSILSVRCAWRLYRLRRDRYSPPLLYAEA